MRLRIAREVRRLRRQMTDAQQNGDLDREYRLLCLLKDKTEKLDELNAR